MKKNQRLLFISDSIQSLPKVRVNDWKQWILTLQTQWDISLYLKYEDSFEKKTHEIDDILHSNKLGGYTKTILKSTSLWSLITNIIKSKIIIINGIHYGWLIALIALFQNKKVLVMAGDLRWKNTHKNFLLKKIDQLFEYLSFKHAHTIIVSNEIVQKYIAYNYKIRTYYLPNGADFITHTPYNKTDLIKYPFLEMSYYLTISVGEKCIQNELLLNAFSQMPSKQLVFVHDR
jgi:hypothetical protein